jgi:hypothetical protein
MWSGSSIEVVLYHMWPDWISLLLILKHHTGESLVFFWRGSLWFSSVSFTLSFGVTRLSKSTSPGLITRADLLCELQVLLPLHTAHRTYGNALVSQDKRYHIYGYLKMPTRLDPHLIETSRNNLYTLYHHLPWDTHDGLMFTYPRAGPYSSSVSGSLSPPYVNQFNFLNRFLSSEALTSFLVI